MSIQRSILAKTSVVAEGGLGVRPGTFSFFRGEEKKGAVRLLSVRR